MFDPTVFDNLKVVIEGALYDLDLDGQLIITNRKDEIELATMSRHYQIMFTCRDINVNRVEAYLDLQIDLNNLAVELQGIADKKPGCQFEIGFLVQLASLDICSRFPSILNKIWGESRQIQQHITFEYGKTPENYTNNIKILFNRLLYEDNIDDLLEMIDYIITSIYQLNKANMD